MQAAFPRSQDGTWPEVIVFGEGYGEKIQNGGRYRQGVAVRIFDVLVGEWWLHWSDVEDVAKKLQVLTVPALDEWSDLPATEGQLRHVLGGGNSWVAGTEGHRQVEAEGVVARTEPLLFMRDGQRLMWKLKFSDFRKGRAAR